MQKLLSAEDLKIRLISWLLPKLGFDEVLSSELRFHDGKRRADLAICSEKILCALEIKGPRDNLDKLVEQLNDYSKMFNEVYVVTTDNFLPKIRNLTHVSIGIIVVSEDEITIVRQSKRKKLISSEAAASWLQSNELRLLLKGFIVRDKNKMGIAELKEKAIQLFSKQELNKIAHLSVLKRQINRHNAFINELGKTITLDDLKMLTVEENVISFLTAPIAEKYDNSLELKSSGQGSSP